VRRRRLRCRIRYSFGSRAPGRDRRPDRPQHTRHPPNPPCLTFLSKGHCVQLAAQARSIPEFRFSTEEVDIRFSFVLSLTTSVVTRIRMTEDIPCPTMQHWAIRHRETASPHGSDRTDRRSAQARGGITGRQEAHIPIRTLAGSRKPERLARVRSTLNGVAEITNEVASRARVGGDTSGHRLMMTSWLRAASAETARSDRRRGFAGSPAAHALRHGRCDLV